MSTKIPITAKVIGGSICDNCIHKSSQTLYSATCKDGYNIGKQCIKVSACDNYEPTDEIETGIDIKLSRKIDINDLVPDVQ